MSKVLMVKGNTETYVEDIYVEEMEDKGFAVLDTARPTSKKKTATKKADSKEE
ncbi:hypothetical protein ACGCUP_00895 [Eubacteriales bacterium KG125]